MIKNKWHYKDKWQQYAKRTPYVHILLSLAISSLLLAGFIELTENTILKHNMQFFDMKIIYFVQSFVHPTLTNCMIWITDTGSAQFYLIFSSIICLYWLFKRQWTKILILAACLGGAGILNFLLKQLFERTRPDIFRVIAETGYSFPSGHAMGALCFYGLLAFIISLNLRLRRDRVLLYSVATFYILCIGISRIYLGVHYPSDILAGYFAGSTWLFFCISLYLLLVKHKTSVS